MSSYFRASYLLSVISEEIFCYNKARRKAVKLRLEEISKGQEEVIVRYRQMNATVQAICELVQEDPKKIAGGDRFGQSVCLGR